MRWVISSHVCATQLTELEVRSAITRLLLRQHGARSLPATNFHLSRSVGENESRSDGGVGGGGGVGSVME